jgi:hypothetical protein
VPARHRPGDELTDDELRAGLPRLEALAARVQPRFVAFLGLSSYRVATGERKAGVGEQLRTVGGARCWLLPNPSGLNASWQLPRLAEAYGALRAGGYALRTRPKKASSTRTTARHSARCTHATTRPARTRPSPVSRPPDAAMSRSAPGASTSATTAGTTGSSDEGADREHQHADGGAVGLRRDRVAVRERHLPGCGGGPYGGTGP